MRIKTVIAVGGAVGAAIAASVATGLYVTFQDVNEALRKDQVAREVARGVFELMALTSDYLLHYEMRARTQWNQKHESLGRLLEEPGFEGAEEERLTDIDPSSPLRITTLNLPAASSFVG